MSAKFEIYEDSNKEWRFRLKAENGEIVAVSESYSNKRNCIKGTKSVQRIAGSAALVEIKES